MQRGRGGLLHHFETFITGVDGEKTAFVSIISCRNGGASKVHLFVIIWVDFLFEEMNEFFVNSKVSSMSSCDFERSKEFGEGFL